MTQSDWWTAITEDNQRKSDTLTRLSDADPRWETDYPTEDDLDLYDNGDDDDEYPGPNSIDDPMYFGRTE